MGKNESAVPEDSTNSALPEVHIRKKRTRTAAGQTAKLPHTLAIITSKNYQYGISLNRQGHAYLQPIKSWDGLTYRDGQLYLDGRKITKSPKRNELFTDDDLSKFDLMLLRALYNIVLYNNAEVADADLSEGPFTIYLPDLLHMIGMKSLPNKATFDSLYKKMENLQFLLGIINGDYQQDMEIYPVIHDLNIDEKKNTVRFSSPYICQLIYLIRKDSYPDNTVKNGPQNRDGTCLPKATHSYLIKPSLVKESNKRAAEIVVIVVALIEQAGKTTPHIKARTILERSPELKQAYERASSSNKSVILRRAFKKAWVMLREQTELESKYNDPVFFKTELPIPTIKTLDTIITFENHGKKSRRTTNDSS